MIRLHHVAQARSFRILWLMEEMGLDFEVARRSFFDKSLRSPEYLAISPAGRVPAVEIDGRVIYESGAITEYLCATRGMLGRNPGDADWVDWLEWLHFAETIGQHLANLTQQHIALREDWMRSPTVMRLEAKRLEKALEVVEAGLGAQDWLLGSGFSAVDCAVGYGALIGRKFVRFEGLPRVAGWLHRCEERPAFRRALARDGEAEIYRRDLYPPPEG
jgi:glutathione S-transferase